MRNKGEGGGYKVKNKWHRRTIRIKNRYCSIFPLFVVCRVLPGWITIQWGWLWWLLDTTFTAECKSMANAECKSMANVEGDSK